MTDIQKILANNGLDELQDLYDVVVDLVSYVEDAERMGAVFLPEVDELITALNHCETVLLDFDDKVDDFYHIEGDPLFSPANGLPRGAGGPR